MPPDNSKVVSRSALHFLSGTLISRVFGLFRDVAMAFCFGSHAAVAAFMVAFRFANLARRLFGESQISNSFIPHFEALRATSPQRGAAFFRDLFSSLTVFLVLFIAVGEIVLFAWMRGADGGTAEIVHLTMLMLPGLLFICLFALTSSVLQCEKSYFLPGVAPLAFNLVWIGAVFLLRGKIETEAMQWLSLAITLAFLMQWAVTVPKTWQFLRGTLAWKEWMRPQLFSAEVKAVVLPFLLGIVGVGAVQINGALDALFARFASLEGPAYLWYAIRIEQFPLALFGVALSSALLPPLSRAIKSGDTEQFRTLMHFSLRRTFSLMIPCTAALFVLGAASVNLLYGRGNFDALATRQTIFCLWGYGLGLLPSVLILLYAPAFYARKDYRTPTRASLYAVALNVALNALMVFGLKWGAFSIAVATSITALFNYLYLKRKLQAFTGPLFDPEQARSLLKIGLCTLFAAAATFFLGNLLGDPTWALLCGDPASFSRTFLAQVADLLILLTAFAATLFASARLLRADELLAFLRLNA